MELTAFKNTPEELIRLIMEYARPTYPYMEELKTDNGCLRCKYNRSDDFIDAKHQKAWLREYIRQKTVKRRLMMMKICCDGLPRPDAIIFGHHPIYEEYEGEEPW